jgi:formylglycine-generating enzyme required for sulfatase activity
LILATPLGEQQENKMKPQFQHYAKWVALLLIPILVGTGCDGLIGPASSSPTAPSTETYLTAIKEVVERHRQNNSTKTLKQDEKVDIQVNDQVAVKDKGRGLLEFPDHLQVEILPGSELELGAAYLEEGGSIFVSLLQTFGHSHPKLQQEAHQRVEVVTDYAVIRATGTDFLVCHAPELTCLVTLEGETEVEAQGQVVTIKGGEATYILPGQPPKLPICADPEEVRRWLDQKRSGADVEPLGALVAGWPDQGCSASPSAVPSLEGMVNIAAGRYQIGSPQPDEFHLPAQEINLAEFWIDRYEVTNAAYKQFLAASGQPQPAHWLERNFPAGQDNHPATGLTWDQAEAYCRWANKRLPTEIEWEVAARGPGPEPPLYPWGSDPEAGGQVSDLPLTGTHPVGSKSFNKSLFEVYDMAGNVWEWVGEPFGPVLDGYKILRGGRNGWLKDMAYRQQAEPSAEFFVPVAGFRCAADRLEEGQ